MKRTLKPMTTTFSGRFHTKVPQKGKVPRPHYRHSKKTIGPSPQHKNTHAVRDYESRQDFVPSMFSQVHLASCLLRIAMLENYIQSFQSSSTVQSQAFADYKNAIIRRYILQKLILPYKLDSSLDSRLQKGFRQGVTSTMIDCTLRTFQCIVKYIHKHFISSEDVPINTLEFIPSPSPF